MRLAICLIDRFKLLLSDRLFLRSVESEDVFAFSATRPKTALWVFVDVMARVLYSVRL